MEYANMEKGIMPWAAFYDGVFLGLRYFNAGTFK